MAKPGKNKPSTKMSKAPVGSKWFNNVAKSMGITTRDLIKDLTPNTSDFLEYNASDTFDMIKEMRTNMGVRSNLNKQISNIPQIGIGKEALNNILADIKSGNLNNKDRETEGDFGDDLDFSFGGVFDEDDSISFGDENDEGTEQTVTVNQHKTNNILDTLPIAKAMNANTEATVNAIATVADQNIALETEKLMFNHRATNSILGGLSAINDNLSALVRFHGDSTTKFYAASIKYYEDSLNELKEFGKQGNGPKKHIADSLPENGNSFSNSLYTYTGGLKINEYGKVIKENLKAIKEENAALAGFTDMMTDTETLKGLAKNPIGTMMRIGMKSIVPVATKASLQALDASISSVIPAVMSKINNMEDHDNPIYNYMYKILGSKNKLSYKVDLGEFDAGPRSWDGQDKKTLNEIIPAYLRRMEAALTGQTERVFDYKSGTFTNIKDLKEAYDRRLGEVESTGFIEARTKMREVVQSMNANAEVMKQFEKDMQEYFSAITKKGSIINPFLRTDKDGYIEDAMADAGLFDGDSSRIDLMRKAMKGLSTKQLSAMATSGIYDSRKATQEYMDEIRKNPATSGHSTLFNGGLYDADGKLTYDTSKASGRSDRYGLTQLDYLRDIRSIMLNGIKVYPNSGGHGPRSGGRRDPNRDILDRVRGERVVEANGQNMRLSNSMFDEIFSRYDENSGRRGYEELAGISESELQAIYKNTENNARDNKISRKLSSKLGRVNQYTDTVTGLIDNRIYRIMFGNDPDNELRFEDGKLKLKEMINSDNSRTGGMISNTIGFFTDTMKGIGAYFTGQGYRKSDGTFVPPTDDSLLGKMKGFISGSADKLLGVKGDDTDQGLLGKFTKDFMDGYEQFKITLFGDKKFGDESKKETLKQLTDKVKSRLPKSIGAGLASAGVKTLLASKMGILGSILLPGGPIGAAITGTAVGFLSQSESFKNWLFGEKNLQGERMGGFIPKSLTEMIEKNGGTVKKGAMIGGAVGLLPSFFLPGGPITGAVMGVGAGLLSKSDGFQEMMFGKDFRDKNKRKFANGIFGKAFKNSIGKFSKDSDPKTRAFMGGTGLAIGLAQGVGLLPSFLLPGGPITGAMLGLAGGIAASSDKFQQFLFGDKDIDGKRYGGLMTKFTNWFDTTVVTPFKIKATEINDNIYQFVQGKIVNPFLHAFDPLTEAFKFVVDDAKEAMKSTWHKITDGVVGSFNENVVKPFGESLEKYVVNPLKKTFNTMLRMIGKGLGALVASPFKMLAKVGDLADAFNARHVMKDERRNRRQQAKDMLNSKMEDGSLTFKDMFGAVKSQFIGKAEKEEILNRALPYRQNREQKKRDREAELEAKMQERRARREEMQQQYEEDVKFGKKNNWKYASKKQKAAREEELKNKQAWYQEQIALKTEETTKKLTSIDDVISKIPSYEKDKLNALNSIKNSLHSTLDNLSKLSGKGLVDNVKDALRERGQSHADGLDTVPKDGYLAELHEGEMVVPKKGAGFLRNIFGGKGEKKNSIVDTLSKGLFGNKDKSKDKSDRADNSLGLSKDEEKQLKELQDRERFNYASRKNVDYIEGQRLAAKKEKEDKLFKSKLLESIGGLKGEHKKSNNFWEKLMDMGGKLGGFIKGFFPKLGTILAGLGLGSFMNYMSNKDDLNEYRKDDDGTIIEDEVELHAGKHLVRHTAPKVYKSLVRPGIEGGKKAVQAGKKGFQSAKGAIKKVDNWANPKLTITGKDFLGDAYEYTSPMQRKGLQKPVGAVTDFARGAKKKTKDLAGILIDGGKKAVTSLMNFITEKIPAVKKVSGSVNEIFKRIAKDSDSIVKRFGKKITMYLVDSGADLIPIVGQVTEIGMTVWDVGTGLTAGNAGNLFGVKPEDVDTEMRLISSVMQGACKFSWFSIIWLIDEIARSMYGFSFLSQIAQVVYNAIPQPVGRKIDFSTDFKGKDADNASYDELLSLATKGNPEAIKALKNKDITKMSSKELAKYGISAKERMELDRSYKNRDRAARGEKGLSKDAYLDSVSKTVGQKIIGSKTAKNLVGTFSNKSITGHLGLNKDAKLTWKERRKFAVEKTGINTYNFMAKMFGMKQIDDDAYFKSKDYDENGRRVKKGTGTMTRGEARTLKYQKEVDEANAKINERMGKNPKTGLGRMWNNMMMGIEKGKRERARKHIGTDDKKKGKKSSKKNSKAAAPTSAKEYKSYITATDSNKNINESINNAYMSGYFGGSAGKGDGEQPQQPKKKVVKKAVKKTPKAVGTIEKSGAAATKEVDKMYNKIVRSTKITGNKLTKGLNSGNKALTKAFTNMEKMIANTAKKTTKDLDKETKDTKKKLDKSVKGMTKGAKQLFTDLYNKVNTALKSIKDIKISTPSTVSPTFSVADPKKFMTDMFKDVIDKMEEKKDHKKKNNAGSSGISTNLAQKNNTESGTFITPTNNTTTNNSTSNKFVFYSQNDTKWSDKKLVGDKTMSEAGCGPTSIAMAISQMTGEQITPDLVASLGKKELPGYSTYNLFPEIAKKFAMNYEDTESETDIIRYLQSGIPVMLSGENRNGQGNTPYTSDGHVVVANSIKGDDVFVSDPRGKNYSRSYKISDLLNGMNKAMVMKPTKLTKDKLGASRGGIKGIKGSFNGELNTDLQSLNLSKSELKKKMGASGQIRLVEKVLGYAKAFEKKLTYSQPKREYINNNKLASDCSSFTRHVFNRVAGIDIGNTTREQKNAGTAVGMDNAQPGDLVMFNGHVGIVWDTDGNMIDIGSGVGPVIRSYKTSYWQNRGPFIRRVLTNPNQMVSNVVDNPNSALGITTVNGVNVGAVSGGSADGESQAEGPDPMGVFGQFGKIGQNMMASVFNGKDVDLFASSGVASAGSTSGTAMINGKQVKALFTGYYPENSALQGGFKDALGNKLDPNKRTCAAPKEVPFHSKIQIQGTGTDKDGQIYEVTDRGGAIKVRGDEYQFDLLFPNHDAAYGWGRKHGTATISTPDSAGGDNDNNAGSSGAYPTSMNGWAYYSQMDPKWNTKRIGGTSVSAAGCGPTSHAMMLTTMLGQNIRPDVMTEYALKTGQWNSNGMSWGMPDKVAKDFKLARPATWDGNSDTVLSKIKSEIKSGHPVIMSGKGKSNNINSPFTSGGHLVLGVGVDGSGNIIINDPRDPKYTKAYTDDQLRIGGPGLRRAWSFAKTSSSAVPEGFQTDGTFSGGSSDTSGGSQAEAPDPMGVFDQFSKIGQNMVASIFNGKEVDLFASSGGSTGGGVDVSGIGDTKQAVWKFFTGKGYTPEATAGIMGNFQQESTINPTLIQGNGRGPAAGIAQWENYNSKSARWKQMSDYAKSKGKEWTDLQSQLEFVDMELSGSGPVDAYTSQILKRKYGGYEALKSSKDIGKATESFEGSFERAGVKVMEKRKKYAQEIYNQMSGSAGKGDGKTHIIQPAIDKSAKPVTNYNSAYYKGMVEKAGMGEGVAKLKKIQKGIISTMNNSYKFNNANSGGANNLTVMNTCIEVMTEMVAELQAIRTNTGITAENTKQIKIVGANTPVSEVNQNPNGRQISNSTRSANDANSNTGYKLAKSIAMLQ